MFQLSGCLSRAKSTVDICQTLNVKQGTRAANCEYLWGRVLCCFLRGFNFFFLREEKSYGLF